MKVISILQPWASLCVMGHKQIETRSWDTKYRGELLIHASVGKGYKKIPDSDPFWKHYHLLFAKNEIEPIEKLPFGAIIGKVELVDSLKLTGKDKGWATAWGLGGEWPLTEQEKAFGDYSAGRYGWLLSNPIVFEKPIPIKGQLGIWNYEMTQKP